MNQHSIQEAYLKIFCVNGKLWAHDINTKTVSLKPASCCTSEEDFQSEIIEKIQNDTIESSGIKSLKKLLDGKSISTKEYDLVRYWTALHIIRAQKFRNNPNVNYENDYAKMIDIEMIVSHYYKYLSLCEYTDGKFFITSDNPIIEFKIDDSLARVFTLSPTKLLLFSPFDDTFKHTEIEFTELINSVLWSNSFKYVFSNKKILPISTYEENIKKWNMIGVYGETKFRIKNKNQQSA